jgi:DNA gyrase/topoisomerase IV subunit B
MADDKKHTYDESKVKTLSSIEHIRLRTGMYIGCRAQNSSLNSPCLCSGLGTSF